MNPKICIGKILNRFHSWLEKEYDFLYSSYTNNAKEFKN